MKDPDCDPLAGTPESIAIDFLVTALEAAREAFTFFAHEGVRLHVPLRPDDHIPESHVEMHSVLDLIDQLRDALGDYYAALVCESFRCPPEDEDEDEDEDEIRGGSEEEDKIPF